MFGITYANIISILITLMFIILVLHERKNPKKLPIVLCLISIVLTIISFVI